MIDHGRAAGFSEVARSSAGRMSSPPGGSGGNRRELAGGRESAVPSLPPRRYAAVTRTPSRHSYTLSQRFVQTGAGRARRSDAPAALDFEDLDDAPPMPLGIFGQLTYQ